MLSASKSSQEQWASSANAMQARTVTTQHACPTTNQDKRRQQQRHSVLQGTGVVRPPWPNPNNTPRYLLSSILPAEDNKN